MSLLALLVRFCVLLFLLLLSVVYLFVCLLAVLCVCVCVCVLLFCCVWGLVFGFVFFFLGGGGHTYNSQKQRIIRTVSHAYSVYMIGKFIMVMVVSTD